MLLWRRRAQRERAARGSAAWMPVAGALKRAGRAMSTIPVNNVARVIRMKVSGEEDAIKAGFPEGAQLQVDFLCRSDLGDLVQVYATWLQNTQRTPPQGPSEGVRGRTLLSRGRHRAAPAQTASSART